MSDDYERWVEEWLDEHNVEPDPPPEPELPPSRLRWREGYRQPQCKPGVDYRWHIDKDGDIVIERVDDDTYRLD